MYFQKVFYVCHMKYFMFSSMLCQLKVHNIVKEAGRVNLPGTFELSAFVRQLLVFMRHALTNKYFPENFRLVSSWDLLPRFFAFIHYRIFCLRHLNLTMTLSDLFIRWQAYKSFGTTFTPVNDKALQTLSSKTSSVMSAGTGFTLLSLFCYYENLPLHCTRVV